MYGQKHPRTSISHSLTHELGPVWLAACLHISTYMTALGRNLFKCMWAETALFQVAKASRLLVPPSLYLLPCLSHPRQPTAACCQCQGLARSCLSVAKRFFFCFLFFSVDLLKWMHVAMPRAANYSQDGNVPTSLRSRTLPTSSWLSSCSSLARRLLTGEAFFFCFSSFC